MPAYSSSTTTTTPHASSATTTIANPSNSSSTSGPTQKQGVGSRALPLPSDSLPSTKRFSSSPILSVNPSPSSTFRSPSGGISQRLPSPSTQSARDPKTPSDRFTANNNNNRFISNIEEVHTSNPNFDRRRYCYQKNNLNTPSSLSSASIDSKQRKSKDSDHYQTSSSNTSSPSSSRSKLKKSSQQPASNQYTPSPSSSSSRVRQGQSSPLTDSPQSPSTFSPSLSSPNYRSKINSPKNLSPSSRSPSGQNSTGRKSRAQSPSFSTQSLSSHSSTVGNAQGGSDTSRGLNRAANHSFDWASQEFPVLNTSASLEKDLSETVHRKDPLKSSPKVFSRPSNSPLSSAPNSDRQLSPQPSSRSGSTRPSSPPSPLRLMGGCVTKNQAAGVVGQLTDDTGGGGHMRGGSGHRNMESPSQSMSPTSPPPSKMLSNRSPISRKGDDEKSNLNNNPNKEFDDFPPDVLKNKDRRRLSLSDSGPARPVLDDELRGKLFITQKTEHDDHHPPSEGSEEEEEEEESESEGSFNDESGSEADGSHSYGGNSRDNKIGKGGDRLQSPSGGRGGPSGGSPRGGGGMRVPVHRECRRLSVSGMPSSMRQDNFESKRQEVKSDTGYFDSNSLLSLGIGYSCKKGLKPESPNQDDFFIVRIDDWGLYGVFDGHGPYGHDVSNFVQRELPKLIYNDINFIGNPKEALRNSFMTVHRMLEQAAASHNLFDCSLSGSTSTVVLHRPTIGKLYVAHVGDSRCIMGRLAKNGREIEVVDITNDHKPNNEAEKKRIVASGGQVRRLEGDIPYRVFLKGRLYPGLAMSRAIGDTVGGQAGVICDPEVVEVTINKDRDLFIVICSDGVWEFMESAEVGEVVFGEGIKNVQSASEALARESWNRWIAEEGNVVDDITAEIIYLNPDHPIHNRG